MVTFKFLLFALAGTNTSNVNKRFLVNIPLIKVFLLFWLSIAAISSSTIVNADEGNYAGQSPIITSGWSAYRASNIVNVNDKPIIHIYTDLLGTPVAETDINGETL